MTYRPNSDIQLLYGKTLKKSQTVSPSIKNGIKEIKDKKIVAWMVSHCLTSSLRENYVTELSEYIQVDVFGKCGHL